MFSKLLSILITILIFIAFNACIIDYRTDGQTGENPNYQSNQNTPPENTSNQNSSSANYSSTTSYSSANSGTTSTSSSGGNYSYDDSSSDDDYNDIDGEDYYADDYSNDSQTISFAYQWRVGEIHRFEYTEDSSLKMSIAGMNLDINLKAVVVFNETVKQVYNDGGALLELIIEMIEVYTNNQLVAPITQVPPAARVIQVEVDSKGKHLFRRVPKLYYTQQGEIVLGVTVNETGASISAEADGTKVEVSGMVNPSTGEVILQTEAQQKPARLANIDVYSNSPGVPIIPRRLLNMMVLPQNPMNIGDELQFNTPFGNIYTSLEDVYGNEARLSFFLEATTNNVSATSSSRSNTDIDTMARMADRNTAVTMGVTTTGADVLRGSRTTNSRRSNTASNTATSIKNDVDVILGFDYVEGKLLYLEGDVTYYMALPGAGRTEIHSVVNLERI